MICGTDGTFYIIVCDVVLTCFDGIQVTMLKFTPIVIYFREIFFFLMQNRRLNICSPPSQRQITHIIIIRLDVDFTVTGGNKSNDV